MPPKTQGKGKAAKGGKLTKAEKDKLKKEEAERKAKEEEEAKLKAEQEKNEQEERERLEREERQKLWEAEKARHQAELDEVKEILDNNAHQLKTLEETQRSKAKWDRYMLCDGSPDPLIENELNTFMHLWRESELSSKPVGDILGECENTLKLISELEQHIQDSECEGMSEEELQRHKESSRKLQELIGFKLDRTSMELLLKASDNVDPESQNLQFITSTNHITLCVWGNTAKNPRLKSVTFDKQGFTIEIPKVLAVGEVSLRVMLTAYDHLSASAKSFYPKQKKISEVVVEVTQPTDEEKKEGGDNDEKEKEEDEQKNEIAPKSASISRSSKASRKKSGRTGSSKSSKSRKASAKSTKSQTSESQKEQTIKDGETEEGAADDATKTEQSGLDIPEMLLDEEDEDDDEDDDDVVDLRAFGVVGPIMFIELLELPPQPKHVKSWTIQQIVSPDLKRIPYQSQNSLHTAPGSASSSGAPPTSASNTQVQANPPLVMNFRLPSNVLYFEKPQMAWWEPNKNQWRLDGLTDIQFDEVERTVSFKTSGFGPIVTTQDLYLNMPFQSWEIRPHTTNSCLFTLIAAIIELEIDIKDSLCCLAQPDDVGEVSHLLKKWMKPHDLITALKAAGINVFPAVDADKYVSINKKDDKLEREIYQEISMTASAFAYSWSKWNAESGDDKIVLQATEQLQDDLLLEEDWSLYSLTTQSTSKLKMREEDAEFSNNIADSTQLHSNLYHMVQDGASPEAIQRIRDSNFHFVDCVYQLLSATKVVTYS